MGSIRPAPEFDQLADLYDETRGGEPRGDEFAALIADHLPSPHAGAVLEVGVGTGVVALGLIKRAYRVVGLDVSVPMLARARRRLGPTVILGDAMDLPLAAHGVTSAVSVWVVQSVPDPLRLFAEVARVLRPGGRYVVCTTQRPASDDAIGHIINRMAQEVDARRTGKRPRGVSVEQVLDWSARAGFRGEVHPANAPSCPARRASWTRSPASRGPPCGSWTTRQRPRPPGRRSRRCGRFPPATRSAAGSSTSSCWSPPRPPEAGDYQPVAAMIDPLRLVPFMPPSLGASPKFCTVPLALTTQ